MQGRGPPRCATRVPALRCQACFGVQMLVLPLHFTVFGVLFSLLVSVVWVSARCGIRHVLICTVIWPTAMSWAFPRNSVSGPLAGPDSAVSLHVRSWRFELSIKTGSRMGPKQAKIRPKPPNLAQCLPTWTLFEHQIIPVANLSNRNVNCVLTLARH